MAKGKEKNAPDKAAQDTAENPTASGVSEEVPADSAPETAAPDKAAPEEAPSREAELESALNAEHDRYLRLAAEYDNFRKRSKKEQDALRTDIRSAAISELLPVYDNLARALDTGCSDEAFYKGVEMTMTQLKAIFEAMGVSEIPAVGEVFDPSVHNAVMHIEDDKYDHGVIVQEFQKGFKLGDKVIRFSMVQVAN